MTKMTLSVMRTTLGELMTKISSRDEYLFVIKFPVAVSELHVPKNAADPSDHLHHQAWSAGDEKETSTEILEIRVWAKSKKAALDKLASQLHHLSRNG